MNRGFPLSLVNNIYNLCLCSGALSRNKQAARVQKHAKTETRKSG